MEHLDKKSRFWPITSKLKTTYNSRVLDFIAKSRFYDHFSDHLSNVHIFILLMQNIIQLSAIDLDPENVEHKI